jgi:hypothetical protein
MEQPKIHQNAIIAHICESQLLRIAFPKSDFGKHAAGDRDHFLGEIDARRVPSYFLDCGRYVSRPTGGFQYRQSH